LHPELPFPDRLQLDLGKLALLRFLCFIPFALESNTSGASTFYRRCLLSLRRILTFRFIEDIATVICPPLVLGFRPWAGDCYKNLGVCDSPLQHLCSQERLVGLLQVIDVPPA
jgi:hypothetical protein